MTRERIVILVTVAYLLILGVIFAGIWWQRRARMRLVWPAATTQNQMERYGVRYMARLGWLMILSSSYGTVSFYICDKQQDRIFVVFLRNNAFFARMMMFLRVQGTGVLAHTVIVLFEPPQDMMVRIASESKVSLIRYTELDRLEELHQAILPTVTAARKAKAGS